MNGDLFVSSAGATSEVVRVLADEAVSLPIPDPRLDVNWPVLPYSAKEVKSMKVGKAQMVAPYLGCEVAREVFTIDHRVSVRCALLTNPHVDGELMAQVYSWVRENVKKTLRYEALCNVVARLDVVSAIAMAGSMSDADVAVLLSKRDLSRVRAENFSTDQLNNMKPLLFFLKHLGNLPHDVGDDPGRWEMSAAVQLFKAKTPMPLKMVEVFYERDRDSLRMPWLVFEPQAQEWLIEMVLQEDPIFNLKMVERLPGALERIRSVKPSKLSPGIANSLLQDSRLTDKQYCDYLEVLVHDENYVAKRSIATDSLSVCLKEKRYDLYLKVVERFDTDYRTGDRLGDLVDSPHIIAEAPQGFRDLVWDHLRLRNLPKAIKVWNLDPADQRVFEKIDTGEAANADVTLKQWLLENVPLGEKVECTLDHKELLSRWLDGEFAPNAPSQKTLEDAIENDAIMESDVLDMLLCGWELSPDALCSVLTNPHLPSARVFEWFEGKIDKNPVNGYTVARVLENGNWMSSFILNLTAPLLRTDEGQKFLLEAPGWFNALRRAGTVGAEESRQMHLNFLWDTLHKKFGDDTTKWRHVSKTLKTWPGTIKEYIDVVDATYS